MAKENILTKSRIGKLPVFIPKDVEVEFNRSDIKIKGKLGQLTMRLHRDVSIVKEENKITFDPRIQSKQSKALTGTMRALINNMIEGVNVGFKKELTLVGVGYRAQMLENKLILNLGYSHPIHFSAPEGINIEAPSLTDIIIKGSNKQQVGEIAAQIRRFRPPEPYKSKGVRYKGETIRTKEVKKKK